jgi:multidrug efflux pump subunit AcrA (membrane-fusion protein)
MASRTLYSVVAVVGIGVASAGAWWYQSRPQGPKEITGQDANAPQRASGSAPAPAAAASAPRAAGVEVAKVERARLQDDAQSVGSLRSRQSVMLRPEVAGRVRELGFADGSVVRKGQVLVQLDDTLQRAEIKQAQAQVSIAQANLRRNQELVAQSFVAQRVLDESNANLQVAEAQLALACARWSRMAILAPFDGTVGIRNINLGDYVKDGADLVNLEDISSMYVDFRLPERFQGKLRPRQAVQLQLDAFPGRMFKATVEAIDPLLDVNGRSVGVRAVLPNTMGEALPQPGGRPGGPGGPGGAAGAARGGAGKPGTAGPETAGARGAGMGGPAAGLAGPMRPAAAATRPGGREAPAPADSAPLAGAGRGSSEPALCAGVRDTPSVAAAGNRPAAAAGASGERAGGARGAGASGERAGGGRGAGGGQPAPLRPGMFARVTTVFAIKEQAIVVPEEAIVPQGGRQFVIKVVPPSAVPPVADRPIPPDTQLVSLRQEVKLGVRQLGKVEIVDGLQEGETVVVAGQQRLQRDGTPLRVVELGRPPGPRGAGPGPAAGASAPAGAASGALPGASLAAAGN